MSPPSLRRRYRTWLWAAVAAPGLLLGAHAVGPQDVALAKKKKAEVVEEEPDYIALAAYMLKDGHYDRAEAELKKVDLKQEGLDLVRFHLLRGVIALKKSDFKAAKDAFKASLDAGNQDKNIHLLLAQAHFGLKDYDATIAALDKAGRELTDTPDVYGIKATAHWESGRHQAAITALSQGIARFPEAYQLMRMKVFKLIDLGLFHAALDDGLTYLSRPNVTPDDFVAVGEALKKSGQADRARVILEQARLQFPDDALVNAQLAHAYVQSDKPAAAAFLFEQASRLDDKFRLDAAEMYRKASRYDLALAMNAGVVDQAAKMRQRLSILLKMEQYDAVAAMEARLSRLGLLDTDEVRYALAYALYSVGDFDDAERHLKLLQDPQLFDKATSLRKAMASCREAGWECL